MSLATTRMRLASSFANNLARSPVEFAQASLAIQELSGGRFDAGLGAGWDQREADATGLPFPCPRERSLRLREALAIVRELFDTASCSYAGEWYTVEVPTVTPYPDVRPRLVASATGRITARRTIPYVDVLELQPAGFSVPGKGSMDAPLAADVSVDGLRSAIGAARELRPEIELSTFLPFGCDGSALTAQLHERLAGGVLAGLFGVPASVAATVRELADLGYDRVQLGGVTPDSIAPLAAELLA
jgi:alkanesulfonate monooxygenase SsuD/methylene tetrahydromethanopterin reductase-like flavin-dependent oxidoreductase (luciferase family)